MKLVGASVLRLEDPRLLTGRGRFVDDIRLPGIVHVAFVRSSYAHAAIKGINTRSARACPGVLAIVTGEELAGKVQPLRPKLYEAPGFESFARAYKSGAWYPLAFKKVRYVGEPVAAVVANDRYAAEDAAELVELEAEPLPPVVDAIQAMEPSAPLLYEEWGSNVMLRAEASFGDVEKAFHEAPVVVRERFELNRCTAVSIEPRVCLAEFDAGSGRLTLWSSTQIPHVVRMFVAELLSFPESQLRVISPDVGGGFGIKSVMVPEELIISSLALQLRQPVKWTEDRSENFLSAFQAREGEVDLELAAAADGTFLGLKAGIVSNAGAYPALPQTSVEPLHLGMILPGPYRISNYRYELSNVVTNKAPMGPYRGVAGPAATYVAEHLIDILAGKLRIDPALIRERNLVRDDDFPYTAATGLVYDSGRYIETMRAALRLAGYDEVRRQQPELWAQGRYVGVGVANYVEVTSPGSMFYAIWDASGFEGLTVRLSPTGSIEVLAGISSPGQGYQTALAQMVAQELGVALEDVKILMGDTGQSPFSWGVHSSRFAVVCGGAATLAARDLKGKVLSIASHLLGCPLEQLAVGEGKVFVGAEPERAVTLREISRVAYLRPDLLPTGAAVVLEATQYYEPPPVTCPNGTHVAVAEVDIQTGAIHLLKYAVAHDCGTIINPMLVEGQIRGGVAQGIGMALYEDIVYSEEGQLLTGTLMDYTIPTAVEVPEIEIAHLETPSPQTIGGVKGMGEGGAIPPPGAIANAVADALSPFGVRITRLPITPERVVRLVSHAKETQKDAQSSPQPGAAN